MKNLIYILTGILGLVFTSCEPLEDTYEELGDVAPVITGTTNYTLIPDDYEALLATGAEDEEINEYFDSEGDARALIPALLENLYPAKGKDAIANVTFDTNIGNAFTNYTLTLEDYLGLRSGAPDYNEKNNEGFEVLIEEAEALEYIKGLIVKDNPEPKDGDVVLATYNYFEDTDIDSYYYADFALEDDFNSFEKISESGDDQVWEYANFNETFYAEMNGYDSDTRTDIENKDWFISPEIDLTGKEDPGLTITQVLNYKDLVDGNKVFVSSNYTTGEGTSSTAEWTEIMFTEVPTGDSFNPVVSNEYDLSDYADKTIHIAFLYDYPEGDTARWQIRNMVIKPFGKTTQPEFTLYGKFYSFSEESNEWSLLDNQYYISDDADYDAMGEGSGQPGQYNNFSSSVSSSDYLPTFLANNYPYAFEEDQRYVAYLYFSSSSGKQVRGDLFSYTNTAWVEYDRIATQTIQFGKEAEGWLPDNTILYELKAEDYAYITSQLENTEGFIDPVSSMSNFGNFERRAGNDSFWSNEMLVTALGILLNKNVPNAEIKQKYTITIAIYNGARTTEEFKVIKDDNGQWIAQ